MLHPHAAHMTPHGNQKQIPSLNAASRPSHAINAADMTGPNPFPRSSVRLNHENAVPRSYGGFTLTAIARTLTPVMRARTYKNSSSVS